MYDASEFFSPGLCRAARGLANFSQSELANRAHVSRSTIADFERGSRYPVHNNLISVVQTLERAGVTFIAPDGEEGPGVRYARREDAG